jgi:hypothetical protein
MTGHGTRSCSLCKVAQARVQQGQYRSCSMCLQCGSLWMAAAAPLEPPTITVFRAFDYSCACRHNYKSVGELYEGSCKKTATWLLHKRHLHAQP